MIRKNYQLKKVPFESRKLTSTVVEAGIISCASEMLNGTQSVMHNYVIIKKQYKQEIFQDEKSRIEALGGVVLYMGTWRVNGNLAVSRAIGNHGNIAWENRHCL